MPIIIETTKKSSTNFRIISMGGAGSNYIGDQVRIALGFDPKNRRLVKQSHLLDAFKENVEQKIIYWHCDPLLVLISRLRRGKLLRGWLGLFKPLFANQHVIEHKFQDCTLDYEFIDNLKSRHRESHEKSFFKRLIRRSVNDNIDYYGILTHFNEAVRLSNKNPNHLFVDFRDPHVQEKVSLFVGSEVDIQYKERESDETLLREHVHNAKKIQEIKTFYHHIDLYIRNHLDSLYEEVHHKS